MIYLRAGLYAEGSSDYHFLMRLVPRLMESIASTLFPGNHLVEEMVAIDESDRMKRATRAERIAAAVAEDAETIELLIIHSDGAGDPRSARSNCVEPGIAAVHAIYGDSPPFAIGCVPVREIEAWMLTDAEALRTLGVRPPPSLPTDPERDRDPKATLGRILREGGVRRDPEDMYELLGERIDLGTLRGLAAFRAFEAELTEGVRAVARSQGVHRSDRP